MNAPVLRIAKEPVQADAIGPAVVLERGPGWALVRREDGSSARATMALAYRYDAEEGDVLLVAGSTDRCWVIGVISGTGKASLDVPGDLEVRASGTLSLIGEKGLRLLGDEIELAPKRLRVTASSLVETLGTAFRRVSGMLSLTAGETHTVVEGQAAARAKNVVVLTEESVSVDGQQIRLG